jgi:predicted HTH transcriptional regulator
LTIYYTTPFKFSCLYIYTNIKTYNKDVYEFSDNFIRVNFKFNDSKYLLKNNSNTNEKSDISRNYNLSETQKSIIELIKKDSRITQQEIGNILDISRITVARNLDTLKETGYIDRVGATKKGQWIIK